MGLVKITPRQFWRARLAAERVARRGAPAGECTFAEIHSVLAAKLGLLQETSELIAALELQEEKEGLIPVAAALSCLKKERKAADRVVFLSDMYLPSSVIRAALAANGFWEEGDKVYVSCECRASKRDGSLFEYVRGALGGPIDDWIHIGDDPITDFRTPKRLGIRVQPLTICRPTALERELAESGDDGTIDGSREAARFRTARIKAHEQAPSYPSLTGSQTTASVFLSYVIWVLQEAEQRRIRKLYFLSRDGQLLHKIAERVQCALRLDIECHYLYGSRRAWHPAALVAGDPHLSRWALAESSSLTVDNVIARLNVPTDVLAEQLESAGFPERTWQQALSSPDRRRLACLLDSDPILSGSLRKAAESAASLAAAYLVEQGLTNGSSAVVDLGWHGRLQRSMRLLLGRPSGTAEPFFYFFALWPRAAATACQNSRAMVNTLAPASLKWVLGNAAVIEALATADHGTVTGYERKPGQMVRPVMQGETNPQAIEWGLLEYQNTVLKVVNEYCRDPDFLRRLVPNHIQPILDHLTAFVRNPSQLEAACWATIPYSDQQVEPELSRLIPRPHDTNPIRLLDPAFRRTCHWLAGAGAIHGGLTKHTLKGVASLYFAYRTHRET